MAKGRRNAIDASEVTIGQPGVVTMPSNGPAELEKPDIQIVSGPEWKSLAEELAFNEELVEVVVHTTSEKGAEPIVPVWVNGRLQNFIRGQKVVVKRKYVERLARAKPESYRNEEYTDTDGNKSVRWPKEASLRYPFSVTRDDNPRGIAWLQKILAEAA